MTRYAIDADVALGLIRAGASVPPPHRLVAPGSLRSAVLAALYGDARAGRLDQRRARELLDALAGLPIRLLGDRVSRATAWRIAEGLGWDEIGDAEYLAVAQLQADVLVTDDEEVLAAAAAGIVPVLPSRALAEAIA